MHRCRRLRCWRRPRAGAWRVVARADPEQARPSHGRRHSASRVRATSASRSRFEAAPRGEGWKWARGPRSREPAVAVASSPVGPCANTRSSATVVERVTLKHSKARRAGRRPGHTRREHTVQARGKRRQQSRGKWQHHAPFALSRDGLERILVDGPRFFALHRGRSALPSARGARHRIRPGRRRWRAPGGSGGRGGFCLCDFASRQRHGRNIGGHARIREAGTHAR
jgi:hypothetical protein